MIREILPRRYPFLLVDRVIEFNPGVSVVAIKNVTINENIFPSRIPESPVMPDMLIIEVIKALAQVAGIVMQENFFIGGIDKARFKKAAIPGDTLVMRMELVRLVEGFVVVMKGNA